MASLMKGSKGPLSILHSFYKQRVSMAFKKIQVVTIFQPVALGVGKAFSKLNVLPNFSPISFNNLFYATNDGFTS
jgi:hypothetical protein